MVSCSLAAWLSAYASTCEVTVTVVLDLQEELRSVLEQVEMPMRQFQHYLDKAHIFKDTAPGLACTVVHASSMAMQAQRPPAASRPDAAVPEPLSLSARTPHPPPPPPPDWNRYNLQAH